MTVSLVPSLTAHGVVSRQDLPIPLVYLLVGSVAALLVSFLALVVLWREPRLDWVHAGRPLPAQVQRVLDSPALRTGLQVLGLLAAAYVAVAALFGPDDDSNPTPGVVYVLFWVGVPLLSVLLGPVWRLLNPIRTIDTAVTRATGTDPEAAAWPLPHRVGHWPAALMLLAFAWMELAAPDNTSRLVLCLFFGTYLAVNLLAALAFGSRWFSRGDGFEVYSTLLGRLSCLGRRGDGQLVLRNPLAGVAGTPAVPGLSGVVCVLLGSTAYDSLGGSTWWVNVVQSGPLPATLTKTLGLVIMVALVGLLFVNASLLAGWRSDLPSARLVEEFAHTLIPIVAGYVLAHYWSLLVLNGQKTISQLSDPFATGANLLGTAHLVVNPTLADPNLVSLLQVTAIVVGHVVAVVLAHDRALRLLPRRQAMTGQIPLLVLMVSFTVGGLTLLFAA
jgi:hypothetical protein